VHKKWTIPENVECSHERLMMINKHSVKEYAAFRYLARPFSAVLKIIRNNRYFEWF